jgi:hypothetical protein
MPDTLELVFEVATGKPAYMHSIDAAEAVRLGDYTTVPPAGEIDPQEKAAAMARAKGMVSPVHAELQSAEERETSRKQANLAAAAAVAQPVVLAHGGQATVTVAEPTSKENALPGVRQAARHGVSMEEKK